MIRAACRGTALVLAATLAACTTLDHLPQPLPEPTPPPPAVRAACPPAPAEPPARALSDTEWRQLVATRDHWYALCRDAVLRHWPGTPRGRP